MLLKHRVPVTALSLSSERKAILTLLCFSWECLCSSYPILLEVLFKLRLYLFLFFRPYKQYVTLCYLHFTIGIQTDKSSSRASFSIQYLRLLSLVNPSPAFRYLGQFLFVLGQFWLQHLERLENRRIRWINYWYFWLAVHSSLGWLERLLSLR